MAKPHRENCGLIGSVDVADRIDPLYENLVVWFPFTHRSGLNDVGPQRIQINTAGVGDATVEALAGGSRSSLSIINAPAGNPIGSCADFSGAAYISLANSYLNAGGWQDQGDWTVECWVRATSHSYSFRGITGAPDFYWMALQEAEGNKHGEWTWWGDHAQAAGWDHSMSFQNDGTNGKPARTSINQWNHICIQRTGATVQGFIDGNFSRSVVAGTDLVNATKGTWDWFVGASQEAAIGSRPSPVTATQGPRTWIGQLSQFRMYNVAKYGNVNFTPQWDADMAHAYPNPISGVMTL